MASNGGVAEDVMGMVQSGDAMDKFLQNFIQFQREVRDQCLEAGCWYNASDPRSGFALYGTQKARWNEVQAAHKLLGYPVVGEDDRCPMLEHPTLGEFAMMDISARPERCM